MGLRLQGTTLMTPHSGVVGVVPCQKHHKQRNDTQVVPYGVPINNNLIGTLNQNLYQHTKGGVYILQPFKYLKVR